MDHMVQQRGAGELNLPGMTPRVEKLKKQDSVKPQICVERAELFTQSYRQTEGEPFLMRRAKALYNTLDKMRIWIDEGELIVGKTNSKPRGAAMLPEIRAEWFVKELRDISRRDWDQYDPISVGEIERGKAFAPYWGCKSGYEHWGGSLTQETVDKLHDISIGLAHCDNNMHCGHMCMDFRKVLTKGFGFVRAECEDYLSKLDPAHPDDWEKAIFYRAVMLSLEAVTNHILRYARLAAELAEKEKDPVRRDELLRISRTCEWVSVNPARNFYEAIQLAWFAYIGALIEGWGMSLGFGRFDQYMYPYYEKDLAEGRLTRDEALELIELLIIKINSSVVLQSADIVHSAAGFMLLNNLTIAGTDETGEDAVNEISHLVLEAEYNVAGTGEDIAIRVSKKTSDDFMLKAVQIAKKLRGKFKWVGDETGIDFSIRQGKTEEIARNFCVAGCVALSSDGRSSDLAHGYFNLPLCLELALNDGVQRCSGKQLGPKTGDPSTFKSYEDVWNAYRRQVEALTPIVVLARNVDEQLGAELTPYPFQAAFFEGCLERGKDVSNGGTYPYMTRGISPSGLPNVADSLAAIKRGIYEEQRFTWDELLDALRDNFIGHDRIFHLIRKMPKYGNDDEYVDSIVNDVLKDCYDFVSARPAYGNARSLLTLQTASANVPLGEAVGALPDGRLAGSPLSEGGISPHPGRNVSGATATIRSANRVACFMPATAGSICGSTPPP
jgi:formate C-acetyltransferase